MAVFAPNTIHNPQKPPRLKAGDTIAVIAPASPALSSQTYDRIPQKLGALGYNVVFGAHARESLGFLAGADSHRLLDINDVFRSPSVRAILCVRGGYGSGRILHSIDFTALKARPKILVGCSDITALLCGVALESNVVCFHGPTAQALSEENCPTFTVQSLLKTITGHAVAPGLLSSGLGDSRSSIDVINSGDATGPLIGGNLVTLVSLIGTKFFPSFDDSILFLEDVGETPFRIDRYLTQFLSLGLLDRVRGFALGTFERCSYRPEEAHLKQSLRDVIIDRLRPLGKPIVLGLPFGHSQHNATLPIGVLATLSGSRGELIIEEPAVS
jgi:muramoyltetrapeptide carboxypeptidase